jgi:TPR repeat protein
MPKPRPYPKKARQAELDDLFRRADDQHGKGHFKSAFRLYLAAAKGGDPSCQINLGNFYDRGIGVRPNRDLALLWYRRAYRQGSGTAAHNIGLLFRHEGNFNQALAWLGRAAKKHDGDANLAIAKIYLESKNDKPKAIHYLKQTLKANRRYMLAESRKEAQRLLKRLAHKNVV